MKDAVGIEYSNSTRDNKDRLDKKLKDIKKSENPARICRTRSIHKMRVPVVKIETRTQIKYLK